MIGGMSTASFETMTVSHKSVGWAGRVDEDTESNNGRCYENVEESHFFSCQVQRGNTQKEIINECDLLLSWTLFEAASRV